MRLNRAEFLAMNNPVRRLLLHSEFRRAISMLHRAGVSLTGATVLDAGCGSGYSTRLLLAREQPGRVIAFDLMPEQCRRAHRAAPAAHIFTADLLTPPLHPSSCDIILSFGLFHHLHDWRLALRQCHRLLRDGGILWMQEPHKDATRVLSAVLRFQFPRGGEFCWPEFRGFFHTAGFELLEERMIWLPWFRCFLLQKARRNGREVAEVATLRARGVSELLRVPYPRGKACVP